MPYGKAELTTWVNSLGLSEEDKNVVLLKLGAETVLAKVGDSFMAQSEFSRKMNELKQREDRLNADFQAKVAEEERKTTDFVNATGTWKADKEKIANEAVQARQKAEELLSQVQTQIKTLATDYGIPEDRLPKFSTTQQTPTATNNNPPLRDDEGKFVTREYFDGVANNVLKLPAIIQKLDREYVRLFGNEAPIIDWEKVIDDARKSKRTLMQEWELQFKVPERRAELAKTAHDKEIADAERRGAETARSALLAENPGLASGVRTEDHRGSPILDRARTQAAETQKRLVAEGKAPVTVDEGRGVAAAISAYRSGKYKDGKEAQAA